MLSVYRQTKDCSSPSLGESRVARPLSWKRVGRSHHSSTTYGVIIITTIEGVPVVDGARVESSPLAPRSRPSEHQAFPPPSTPPDKADP